jgi:hypothetical protein
MNPNLRAAFRTATTDAQCAWRSISRGLQEAVHSLTEGLAASGQDMCGPLVAGLLVTNGSAFKKRQAGFGCRALQSWLLSTSRQLARTCAGVPVPVSHARPNVLFETDDPAGSSLSLLEELPYRCLPACFLCLSSSGDSLPGAADRGPTAASPVSLSSGSAVHVQRGLRGG